MSRNNGVNEQEMYYEDLSEEGEGQLQHFQQKQQEELPQKSDAPNSLSTPKSFPNHDGFVWNKKSKEKDFFL